MSLWLKPTTTLNVIGFIELSVSNLASELVKIGFFFRSTTVEEIEIFIIKENYYKAAVTSANW